MHLVGSAELNHKRIHVCGPGEGPRRTVYLVGSAEPKHKQKRAYGPGVLCFPAPSPGVFFAALHVFYLVVPFLSSGAPRLFHHSTILAGLPDSSRRRPGGPGPRSESPRPSTTGLDLAGGASQPNPEGPGPTLRATGPGLEGFATPAAPGPGP